MLLCCNVFVVMSGGVVFCVFFILFFIEILCCFLIVFFGFALFWDVLSVCMVQCFDVHDVSGLVLGSGLGANVD